MPTLTVTTDAGEWNYFQGAKPWPGEVKGFVMVNQGAFKAMDVNLCAEDWLHFDDDKKLFKELMRCTHQSSIFTRTVETVNDTTQTAAFPKDKSEGPVEMLYLNELNSGGNVVVPPILVV
jgi:hypothetical protein